MPKKKTVSIKLTLDEDELKAWEEIKNNYKYPSHWIRECLRERKFEKIDMEDLRSEFEGKLLEVNKNIEEIRKKLESIQEQLNSILTTLTFHT